MRYPLPAFLPPSPIYRSRGPATADPAWQTTIAHHVMTLHRIFLSFSFLKHREIHYDMCVTECGRSYVYWLRCNPLDGSIAIHISNLVNKQILYISPIPHLLNSENCVTVYQRSVKFVVFLKGSNSQFVACNIRKQHVKCLFWYSLGPKTPMKFHVNLLTLDNKTPPLINESNILSMQNVISIAIRLITQIKNLVTILLN